MRAHIPNLLTLFRLFLAPAGALALWFSYVWALPGAAPVWLEDPQSTLRLLAAFGMAAFFIAAISDWLDGYLARRWAVQSAFGALLDPIADKLLVGIYLLVFAMILGGSLYIAVPVAAIILRDLAMTALRLTRPASDQGDLAVSGLAKFKTALEMALIAAGLVLMAAGLAQAPWLFEAWIAALWVTAALSLMSAFNYFSEARRN